MSDEKAECCQQALMASLGQDEVICPGCGKTWTHSTKVLKDSIMSLDEAHARIISLEKDVKQLWQVLDSDEKKAAERPSPGALIEAGDILMEADREPVARMLYEMADHDG